MKTAIIPAFVLAVCGTMLTAQNNVQDLQANAKTRNATSKVSPVSPAKRPAGFYMQKEIYKKPLIDKEPSYERKSSLTNAGTVSVKAYPNPFAGDLTISINDATGSEPLYEATVFDLQGRKVYSQNIVSKKEKMNLSALSSGMYILLVQKNGVVVMQEKVAKE